MERTMKVAFATWRGLPALSPDDRLAAGALADRGIEVEPAVWDDPGVRWGRYGAVVVRSCWDYHLREGELRRWIARLEALGVPLWNPPALLRWNMNKHYLRDLAARGVPILPTVWLERGERAGLSDLLAANGWDQAVVKPTVSASAHETWRTSPAGAPGQQQRFETLLARGGVMVQRFAEEIETAGEWSLLFFGGRFSHAVIKRPRPGDFRVQAEHGGIAEPAVPPPAVLDRAGQALAAAPGSWLYARVDGCESAGGFHLMELEMLEPWLFFAEDPEAPGRFADSLAEALGLPHQSSILMPA
jgi:glutathione synthase/RimK-type ligase-like ATP-grasp enzyme